MIANVTLELVLCAGKEYPSFMPVCVYKDLELPSAPFVGLNIFDSIVKLETKLIVEEVTYDTDSKKYTATIILEGFTDRDQAIAFARMGADYHGWYHYLDINANFHNI
ncbi:hypothetical protein [Ignatzschineria cameli]|uniref:Uncharacterized protein n=1 Tax=Ignatzschineria cameli TaxID=2182793 RepID=A0A2U2AQT4_9GAMM|nr:hypothetical protein [Ignatzschineria cameli]PWD86223.1 hypothetical protein DC077_05645 [Ignatzschineria cameli]PWD89940.1 hypothetical protein DC079_06285 [Ignatzschineria cameli]PWD91590.1 hypothetical protein DC081_05995 [Ignatzschineria cameli]PWD92627.1 hypothetical protein DC078_06280 [Ignatzschineria cameli]